MFFCHLALFEDRVDPFTAALLEWMQKEAVFTWAWEMTNLSNLARAYPAYQAKMKGEISKLNHAELPAVQSVAEKSLITHLENQSFPKIFNVSLAI